MASILITGGTGHLGKVVVGRLFQGGHQLHLATRNGHQASQMGLNYHPTDLTDKVQCKQLVETLLNTTGSIDAGVFIAGGFLPGSLQDTSMEDVDRMVTMNFATAFNTAIILIQHFRQVGGGKLIFIGAKAAAENSTAVNNIAYSLSKQMLFQFSAMINECEATFNTSSFILLPRTLDTSLNRSFMPDADYSNWTAPEVVAAAIERIVQGKEEANVINL